MADRFADEATASKCPVCGGGDTGVHVDSRSVALTPRTIGSSRAEVSVGVVLRCRNCGHGFREGSFSDSELAALYESMDVGSYEAEETFRLATARRHLDLIRSVNHLDKGRRLLDVGCASGLFLEQAMRSGWIVAGAEPNKDLVAKADERLGAGKVQCATLAEAQLEPGSFDVITAWDVLEHMSNPAAFLRQCARLLRSGGALWLKVPDIESLQARWMRARWPVYLPEHLGYFTRKSLALCARDAGLRVAHVGRGSVTFSAGYVFLRLTQHKIPFSSVVRVIVQRGGLANVPISLRLGEIYARLEHGVESATA